MSVDLPEPVAPTMPTRSPGRTSKLMFLITHVGSDLSTTEDTEDTEEKSDFFLLSSASSVVESLLLYANHT